MGTRNLTCVYIDGEYKVAQYCQWDGYPSGVGFDILNILRTFDYDILKEKCRKLTFYSEDEIDKINKDLNDKKYSLAERFPELHRDTGPSVLNLIYLDKTSKLFNDLNFAQDSLFCEYCYVIDLDSMKLEVFRGFNKNPLKEDERFYYENQQYINNNIDSKYYGVKFLISFDLNKLPENEIFQKEIHEKEIHEKEICEIEIFERNKGK